MVSKSLLSAVAIAITLFAFLPYIRAILTSAIRPHVFSWFIWGTTTVIVFLAQLQGHGGAGAWPIGVSGSITVLIAALAYWKRADISITAVDWLFLVLALSSLPFWYFTADPLWAVLILTVVDLLGFGPTLRKAYTAPRSESVLFFATFAVRNFIVILALENYSLTTVLFPAAIAIACLLLIALILYRRRVCVGLPPA
ncbi:MAG: hypothetical protein GC149_05685 [Gammaproteobacteria bacterium]|nr:hypothetical protein [Gammaproteobacteria bacterium]